MKDMYNFYQNKIHEDMFESCFLVEPLDKIQTCYSFSRKSSKTANNTKSSEGINLPNDDSDANSIRQKYQEQIDAVLDNPNERYLIISISSSHLHILKCNSRADFEEIELKPLIKKAATKRNLDFDYALDDVVSSRINWEGRS